jgi:two-component system, cell cycle response regulator
LRVVIADDDPDSLLLLEVMLVDWGYEVLCVTDGEQAWAALTAPDAPRLAILDWMMPGSTGPEVCRRLQDHGALHVYTILVTARGNPQDIVKGLGAGADDFLVKPYEREELRARLGAGARMVERQDAWMATNRTLLFDATHDPLTGMGNRAMIIQSLLAEMDRAARLEHQTAVVFADLDHFKHYNDTYGHVVGDRVLVEAAERIASSVRPYDVVGRYGGEEFLVILPACDRTMAGAMAERIRERVAAKPIRIHGADVRLTASFGVAACCSVGAVRTSPAALITAADVALYRAKEAGRNRVEVASPEDVATAAAMEERGASLLEP